MDGHITRQRHGHSQFFCKNTTHLQIISKIIPSKSVHSKSLTNKYPIDTQCFGSANFDRYVCVVRLLSRSMLANSLSQSIRLPVTRYGVKKQMSCLMLSGCSGLQGASIGFSMLRKSLTSMSPRWFRLRLERGLGRLRDEGLRKRYFDLHFQHSIDEGVVQRDSAGFDGFHDLTRRHPTVRGRILVVQVFFGALQVVPQVSG